LQTVRAVVMRKKIVRRHAEEKEQTGRSHAPIDMQAAYAWVASAALQCLTPPRACSLDHPGDTPHAPISTLHSRWFT
jgi:hypothetical protein